MKRLTIAAATVAALSAVPAQANEHHPRSAHARDCTPHAVGYHAAGTLVSQSLTQTAGVTTATRRDDRYSGDVTVDLKRANHGAPTNTQTFTLVDARVKFYDANHDGTADQPTAGDRVQLYGKVTKLRRRCDPTGFTPQVTVNRVQFKAPRPAATKHRH
jgi:hypothetical protein